ncbi:trigger factor family protein [bacterium]|nr:trigger factor family protein [bacterium]MBR2857735.1 trigger factor family protein [bacterium]
MENAAKNVRIEGFRKGKVPVQLAEKYINKNNVYEKAINKVINEIVPKFEESNDFKNIPDELLEKPVINVDKANDNELSISLAYDKMPKIKLKDYKKIPLD